MGIGNELTIAMRLRGARAANAQLRGTATEIDRVNAAARRSTAPLGRMSKSLERTGTVLTRRLSLPIAVTFGIAVKKSIDFSQKMSLLETQAGASAGEVKRLHGAVLDIAKGTTQGPDDLADALFRLESHGIRGAAALRALKASADLAMTGNADLESVTYALAAAQQSHIKGTETEAKTAATLNSIIGQGSMRMEDLVGALSTGLLPRAKTFGLTLRDIGSALDVMTSKGVPAQAAATRLSMSLSLLAAPSPAADRWLKKIGLTGNKLAHDMQKPKGLQVAISDLAKHLDNVRDKAVRAQILSRAFGGGRTSGTIMTLVQSTGELDKRMAGVTKGTALYNAQVAAARKQPINQLKTAWSSVQVSLVKLGAALTPLVLKMAKGLSKIADLIAGHPSAGLSLLAALLLLGPVLRIIAFGFKVYRAAMMLAAGATMAETVATEGLTAALLANPIGLLIIGLIALGAALIYAEVKFHLISRTIMWLWGWIKKNWPLLLPILFGPFGIAAMLIIRNFAKVKAAVFAVVNAVKRAVKWISHLWHTVTSGPGKIFGGISSGFGVSKFFADGGHVATRTTAVVGERGPEIVSLPAGARVHPNTGGGGDFATVPIVLTVDGRVLHDAVVRVEKDKQARR